MPSTSPGSASPPSMMFAAECNKNPPDTEAGETTGSTRSAGCYAAAPSTDEIDDAVMLVKHAEEYRLE